MTVTRNEIPYALNQAGKFLLAVVVVGENDATEGPWYVRNPFAKEPDWGVASVNYELAALLKRYGADLDKMPSMLEERARKQAADSKRQRSVRAILDRGPNASAKKRNKRH